MNVLQVLLFGLGALLSSCTLFGGTNSSRISYVNFESLNLGKVKIEEVRKIFGSPHNAFYLDKENRIVEKSEKQQWIYKDKDINKMYLYFESDILVSKSWDVREEDKESSIEKLLLDLDGDWAVVKEPMTNPHAGPTECYLEDLKNGKLITVHGYKKNVSEISMWIPDKKEKSIKEQLNSNVGKEFCIANRCSKVSDPELWKLNHCEWLEQIVANHVKKNK